MRYLKQVGTVVCLGALMMGLAACGGKKKTGENATPTPAPTTAPAGEAPKK
ncbi:MAG: hypothetical protein WCA07_08420 [Gloeobacterales cyanobacterium]|jgi:hypothetical protein